MQLQKIQYLTPKELNIIVDYHFDILNESFLSKLGKDFLKIVYNDIPKNKQNIFFVLKEKGQLIGYAIATKNSDTFNSKIVNHNFTKLTKEIIKSSIKNPSYLFKILVWFVTPKQKEIYPAELLFLAISKKYQHKGLGTKMIKKLFQELKKSRIEYLRVGTKANNLISNNFYKKLGFKFLTNKEIFGDKFNYYLSPKILP